MAAAALLFADWRIYRNDRRWQLLGIAQCAIMAISCWHASFSGAATAAFYVFAPTAGAALQHELKRFLPFFASLWAVILLASGINSENFTGLTGNWNWTQVLLIALLPGIPLLWEVRRWKSVSALLITLCSGALWYCCPPIFSRALLPAAIMTAGGIFCANRLTERRKTVIYAIAFLLTALLFGTLLYFGDWNDSRFQLWKGAFFLASANLPSGVGAENFASAVLPFIPDNYFFTSFAAPWHPHPHNELLNFLCAYGIAGGFYLFALVNAVFTNNSADDRGNFSRWIFLYLLICGMFDMSCAIVSGAWWCFLCAGIGIDKTPTETNISPLRMVFATAAIVVAGWMIAETIVSTINLRRGEMALYKHDTTAAGKYLRRSSTPLAQYRLAELKLMLLGDPQYAVEKYQHGKIFLHSQRLLALGLMRKGDISGALTAMRGEINCYPFSVINARLYCIMLKIAGVPKQEFSAAYNRFLSLCRLRNISPAAAGKLKTAQDDLPLGKRQ